MGIPVLTEPHLIEQLMSSNYVAAARLLQIVTSVGSFLVPGWIFTKVIDQEFSQRSTNSTLMAFAGLIPLVSFVVVGWLAELNGYLTFPIESIDRWMRTMEAQATAAYDDFLQMDGVSDLGLNILMMALIPAVGEELLFRAGLQQYLGKYLKNHHVAIWVAAVLFSAIHLQFYTFIPRLIMGAGLGYLFFWGGHIGYAIIAHFVNNAAAVMLSYATNRWISEESIENFGAESNLVLIGSMIVLGGLFYGFRGLSRY